MSIVRVILAHSLLERSKRVTNAETRAFIKHHVKAITWLVREAPVACLRLCSPPASEALACPVQVPQQDNSSDCGLFLLLNLSRFLSAAPDVIHFAQVDDVVSHSPSRCVVTEDLCLLKC
jgi:hypothetical protein